jgi:hypothetical protein
VAFVVVLAAGAILIPRYASVGAAVAGVLAESALAAALLAILLRSSEQVRPRLGFAWKVALAAVVAAGIGLIPGLPAVVDAALAATIFLALSWVLGALPDEVLAVIPNWRFRA